MNGLISILDLASWYYKGMNFDTYLPEQRGIDCISEFLSMTLAGGTDWPNNRVRLHLMGSGIVCKTDDITVTAFSTDHMKAAGRPAYGYLVEAEGKKIYISGDLNGEEVDIPEFVNKEVVDLFVVECAHFPAEKLIEKLKECKAKCVMPIHVFPLDKYDVLQDMKKGLSFELVCPKDGESYMI